jgi:uncharacterized membrane protein
MNIPILLAISAMLGWGVSGFFWRVAAANKTHQPSYLIVQGMLYMFTVIVIHLVQRHSFSLPSKMAVLASISGIIVAWAAFAMMLGLALGGQASTVFPIAGLFPLVPVVLSFIIFREPITATKLLGLGLGVSSIILLSR